MASIAYGPMIANASGKVGGVVFTSGHSTPVTRVRVKPRNPSTTAQTAVRSYLTAASRAYKGLSSSDLALWAAFALTITKHNPVSGKAYHPTGIDIFTSLASKFLQITPGGTIPVTPPTSSYSGDTTVPSAVGGTGDITISFSADQTTGSTTEILIQHLASPARKPSSNAYKHQAFTVAAMATPYVISSLLPGTYSIAYKFCKISTGQTSSRVILANVTVS